MTNMKRFFISPAEVKKDSPVIAGPDAHHMAKVFRLKPTDHVLLVDGTGMEYEAEITGLSKNQVRITIVREYAPATESPVRITVGQGYLKDKKMDMLVRHLTETGIHVWLPVVTEFSVPVPDKKKSAPRLDRWEGIAKEAVKQCGRTRVPEIMEPVSLPEVIQISRETDVKIVFYEKQAMPVSKLTSAISGKQPGSVFVLLGPEGGFSDKEIELVTSNGFVAASLGPRILRAETASISACTLIQHLFGDMR